MTAPVFQGKTSWIRQFVAAVQASATAVVDASVGSLTLAWGQAVTGVALWLQAQIAAVLLLTRASTSFGTDLDSWCAQFFFYRLPATLATGQATFSRATPTLQAVVPVGQLISTGPGGLQFIVTQDATNAAWNAGLNGYVLAPSTTSVTVPISATVAGSGGNVLANTITSFVSPIPGVDSVTNASALTNGLNAETDPAFLARFQNYIQSLQCGTLLAIITAISAIQQGILCFVLENVDTDLTADNGMLTIVVDDGTGSPPTSLINAASLAVDAVRAAGIRFGVIAPVVTNVVITLTVVSINSSLHAADITAATNAITAYVNSLREGQNLVWARIYQLAFDSSANISGVNSILVNSGTADITVTAKGVIKTVSVTVS